MVDDDHDDDEAAEARGYRSSCLKLLVGIAQNVDVDPEVRGHAWQSLQHALVQVRRFIVTPGIPSDARAQAEATLRGFLDC